MPDPRRRPRGTSSKKPPSGLNSFLSRLSRNARPPQTAAFRDSSDYDSHHGHGGHDGHGSHHGHGSHDGHGSRGCCDANNPCGCSSNCCKSDNCCNNSCGCSSSNQHGRGCRCNECRWGGCGGGGYGGGYDGEYGCGGFGGYRVRYRGGYGGGYGGGDYGDYGGAYQCDGPTCVGYSGYNAVTCAPAVERAVGLGAAAAGLEVAAARRAAGLLPLGR